VLKSRKLKRNRRKKRKKEKRKRKKKKKEKTLGTRQEGGIGEKKRKYIVAERKVGEKRETLDLGGLPASA